MYFTFINNVTAISDHIYLETDDNKSLNHWSKRRESYRNTFFRSVGFISNIQLQKLPNALN